MSRRGKYGLYSEHLTDIRIRRLSAGEHVNPIPALRDIDQPFIFEIKFGKDQFRFELYDTSSPDNWKLLDPDVVVICYDISNRLSLINMKRYVCIHQLSLLQLPSRPLTDDSTPHATDGHVFLTHIPMS